jgi:dsRNA-specific ribonuclease
MSIDEQKGIYLGSRGADFKTLISTLLRKGGLKSKYINMLTDIPAMKIYGCAFTSELVDPDNNYQVLEQIGDLSGNKFIVNYMYQRFPQLDCAEGVKVVARLRINYGAKESFCEIARKLGFWEFISATNDLRHRKMKPLLEDVFEAFLGATERILDKRNRVGVGYAIVHDILTTIFDEMHISLRYEDLYDAKTRLKETFDMHESALGPLVYKERKSDMLTFSTAFRVKGGKYAEKTDSRGKVTVNKKRIIGGRYIKIGDGSAALKSDAQQKAAAAALDCLSKDGWSKSVPAVYKKFNKGEYVDDSDICCTQVSVKNIWGTDMNALHQTKEKSKYQNKYRSSPLAMYCRLRNTSGVNACLSLGADPNVQDTDGMYPTDLLFIGKTDDDRVKEILEQILEQLLNNNGSLKMSRQVFEVYYAGYVGDYFGTIIDKLVLVG